VIVITCVAVGETLEHAARTALAVRPDRPITGGVDLVEDERVATRHGGDRRAAMARQLAAGRSPRATGAERHGPGRCGADEEDRLVAARS